METKRWYLSKTVWAGIVTAVVGTLSMLGVGQLEGEEETITTLIMSIVTIVMGILAVIGRIVAKGKITPVILLAVGLLFFAGCRCPQNDPQIIASGKTMALVGHARAADCFEKLATLTPEEQAVFKPNCNVLESMAAWIDSWEDTMAPEVTDGNSN